MTDLRMSAQMTAIEPAIDEHARSNARADGDIDQVAAASSCSTPGLGESRGVSIVLHRDLDLEAVLEFLAQIAALPSRQCTNIADDAGGWIERPGAGNANA